MERLSSLVEQARKSVMLWQSTLNVTAEDQQIQLELIDIECRAEGLFVRWEAGDSKSRVLGHATVEASDDIATDFRVVSVSVVERSGRTRGTILCLPSPPKSARRLHFEFQGFLPFPQVPHLPLSIPSTPDGRHDLLAEHVHGKWQFDIDLGWRARSDAPLGE
jgi:hypothetical protein